VRYVTHASSILWIAAGHECAGVVSSTSAARRKSNDATVNSRDTSSDEGALQNTYGASREDAAANTAYPGGRPFRHATLLAALLLMIAFDWATRRWPLRQTRPKGAEPIARFQEPALVLARLTRKHFRIFPSCVGASAPEVLSTPMGPPHPHTALDTGPRERPWRRNAGGALVAAWAADSDERRAAVWLVDRCHFRGAAENGEIRRRCKSNLERMGRRGHRAGRSAASLMIRRSPVAFSVRRRAARRLQRSADSTGS